MAGAVFFFILFLKAKSRIRDHGGEIAQIRGIFRLILSEENFMSMSEKEKREGWQGLSLTLSSQLLDGSTLSSWVESLHRSWCKDERLTYTTTAVKNSPVYKRSRRWLHVWWFFTSFDGSRENELVALDVGWQVVVGGIVYCILSTFVVNVFFSSSSFFKERESIDSAAAKKLDESDTRPLSLAPLSSNFGYA